MNKELPCYIISDLLPLYQDDMLSEQTKKDIDKHLIECKDCKKKMDAMKMQIDVQTINTELKTNPLKKVRFYQKTLTVLGAVIGFFLGACYPIAKLGIAVLERGEIATYQIERLKSLWYIFALESCFVGIIVCAIYFLFLLLMRKMISKNAKKKIKPSKR
ncbi:MAG: zf-HC2 domain-containing protein [Lachnospiraceae bacterium]